MQFPTSIAPETIEKLKSTYSDEWDTIITDARSALSVYALYYRKVLRGEAKEEIPEAPELTNPEEQEEEQL